jgi:hypothetical protein
VDLTYQKLHKVLRLVCQLNLCKIDFQGAQCEKELLNKLASVQLHKSFFAPSRQFIKDTIKKDYRALDACKHNVVIKMIHEGPIGTWNGFGQKVDTQSFEKADLIFHVDGSAKKYFFGLLEGLTLSRSHQDAQEQTPQTETQRDSLQKLSSKNETVEIDKIEKGEQVLRAVPGLGSVMEDQHSLTDRPAFQDDEVFNNIGKILAEAVFDKCEPDKVRRFAKDIGFKGDYISLEREHLYLVLFLQFIACQTSFVEHMVEPIMDSLHRCIYEIKFGLPPDPAKVGQFEGELKTRYHLYQELVMHRTDTASREFLLAELPYYFLAHALNRGSDEATNFISRQNLCKHLGAAGLQYLKKFIEGLSASSIATSSSLRKKPVDEK